MKIHRSVWLTYGAGAFNVLNAATGAYAEKSPLVIISGGPGIQATTGKRPLILVGDGAFQMTGWELGNCRRYGWDPIVIVFNNCSWEMLRTFQPGTKFNDLDDWKFADLATVLGGDGYRATTRRELKDAINKAYNTRGKFQLIEVMMDRNAISPTLKRFIAAIQKTN